MRNNITRFYEPPLYTNITFVNKQKRKSKALAPTDSIFNVNDNTLSNLEFRRDQIEKMIGKIKNKSVS
jgi:hypothetical protein